MRAVEYVARLVRAIGTVAACLLLPAQLAVSTSYVVGRQIWAFPGTAMQELEWHFFMTLVFLTLGLAYLDDRHVRIDVLRDRFGPRLKAWIEVVGVVVALVPFCVVVIYLGSRAAWQSFLVGEASHAALGLPYRWIVRSVVPLGALFLLAAGGVVAARNVETLRRR